MDLKINFSLSLIHIEVEDDKLKASQDIIPNNMNFLKNKNLTFIVNAQCNAAKNIFKLKKIPFRQITFNKKNEEELGKIFTFLL